LAKGPKGGVPANGPQRNPNFGRKFSGNWPKFRAKVFPPWGKVACGLKGFYPKPLPERIFGPPGNSF